jgi:hypothetical protein
MIIGEKLPWAAEAAVLLNSDAEDGLEPLCLAPLAPQAETKYITRILDVRHSLDELAGIVPYRRFAYSSDYKA